MEARLCPSSPDGGLPGPHVAHTLPQALKGVLSLVRMTGRTVPISGAAGVSGITASSLSATWRRTCFILKCRKSRQKCECRCRSLKFPNRLNDVVLMETDLLSLQFRVDIKVYCRPLNALLSRITESYSWKTSICPSSDVHYASDTAGRGPETTHGY